MALDISRPDLKHFQSLMKKGMNSLIINDVTVIKVWLDENFIYCKYQLTCKMFLQFTKIYIYIYILILTYIFGEKQFTKNGEWFLEWHQLGL